VKIYNFFIYHDPLKQLFERETWQDIIDLGWAERFITVHTGEYGVSATHPNGRTVGDSPELMPLDSHLFSDLKRDLVRFTAMYPDLFDLSRRGRGVGGTPPCRPELKAAGADPGHLGLDSRMGQLQGAANSSLIVHRVNLNLDH
jgi:hypothetical protein